MFRCTQVAQRGNWPKPHSFGDSGVTVQAGIIISADFYSGLPPRGRLRNPGFHGKSWQRVGASSVQHLNACGIGITGVQFRGMAVHKQSRQFCWAVVAAVGAVGVQYVNVWCTGHRYRNSWSYQASGHVKSGSWRSHSLQAIQQSHPGNASRSSIRSQSVKQSLSVGSWSACTE